MGLVIPGFIPTPLGEVFEYALTLKEIGISVGIWALGCLLFTILVKAGIAIELGRIGNHRKSGAQSGSLKPESVRTETIPI